MELLERGPVGSSQIGMTKDMRDASEAERGSGRVIELCHDLLGRGRLILASNRGPVEHRVMPTGQLQARRGSGTVVTALSSLTRHVDFTWVASAMGEGDRQAAAMSEGASIKSPLPGQCVSLRYVVTPRRVYHKYYNIFCNPLLWFLHHYMWSSSYTPNIDINVYDAWENGYKVVNEAFAQSIIAEAQNSGDPPYVIVHDYHLYMVPGYVRQGLPNCKIQHIVHVPWPSPIVWQLLPRTVRETVCESLCSSDIVGFQCMRDARSFLIACEAFLKGAEVDYNRQVVHFGEREVLVRTYPLSIDAKELRHIAGSTRALEFERSLKPLCGEHTIVRVDRAEPSKNIVRGFKAFRILLESHPELHDRVKFLAFLAPPQAHIRQYQRYLEEVDQQVQSINSTFGNAEWQPIQVFYENNYIQAIAGLRLYDTLLVNSVIDGMNLVAKEGPVVNTKSGVLILSDCVGAFDQLQEGALCVSPADLEGTMQAMYQAITMSPEERQRRSSILVQAVQAEDVTHWLECQLEDLKALG